MTQFLFRLPQNWPSRQETQNGRLGRGGPFFLLLLFLLAGCGHSTTTGDAKSNAPRPVVQTAPVSRQTLEQALPVSAVLQALPGQEAMLSFAVPGTLNALPVRVGQSVQSGQVVAQLTTRSVQGQIQQAQATVGQNEVQVQQAEANALQQQAQTRTAILQAQASVQNAQATLAGTQATLTGSDAALLNAEQTLARTQTLFADGLVPQKDVEAAHLSVRTAQAGVNAQKQAVDAQKQTVAGQRQAVAAARAAALQDIVKQKDVLIARQQVQNAQGALNTARAQLALYTLRAPLSGQITAVGANVGETVDTSTKVVTIANLSRLQIVLSVPAANAAAVRVGQTVTFTVEGVPGRTFRAAIARIGSQTDAATGTVPAYAAVANPAHALRDDTTVQASIVTVRREHVLTVPASAILTDPDTGTKSVTTVGVDSVAHVVSVKTGLAAQGRVEIKQGVTAGQRVAVSGQYGLPDGTAVAVQKAANGN